MTETNFRIRKGRRRVLAAGFCLVLLIPRAGARPQEHNNAHAPASTQAHQKKIDGGRQTFESRCAGCHGLDGRGGERAPDIATEVKAQERADAELLRIIRQGLPKAGMPAFASLDPRTAQSLVQYVRILQGKGRTPSLPGNPARGEELFFGSARCGECHMVHGKGGFIAPDLTGYSRTHNAKQIRKNILAPEPGRNGRITVSTRDGKSYAGILRNEDNFSLQMQTLDGQFLFWNKADLQEISREAGSMHGDLGKNLSAEEIRDLVSYLIRIGGPPQKQKTETFEE